MDARELHEAALTYLSRRPATAAMMARVLERRARKRGVPLEDVEDTIASVIARLIEVGLVDDATFAAARVERLGRQGRSSRAIAAHLAQKGVSSATSRSALSREARPADADYDAALVLAKKRRLGPFAREEDDADTPEARRKALGVFARAGFDRATAERALRTPRDEAEERLFARRSL